MIRAFSIALLALCGCHTEFHKGGMSVAVGFGVRPPTNAVVAVTFTKIGIVVEQNPATQMPTATIGYERGAYHRIPILNSNEHAASVSSGVETIQQGITTTIREQLEVR